ncbi:MAG: Spy/CpxP family protein refolding chaperone [candidate division WOR-3 bacterium]
MRRVYKIIIMGLILFSSKMLYGKEYAREEYHLPFIILLKDPSVLEELSLSEEQKEKIKDIHFSNEKAAEEIKSKIRIKEIELRKILFEKKPDIKTVENKIKEIGELNTDLRILKMRKFFQIKEVLTEEQWEKFKEIVSQRPFLRERIKRRFKD